MNDLTETATTIRGQRPAQSGEDPNRYPNPLDKFSALAAPGRRGRARITTPRSVRSRSRLREHRSAVDADEDHNQGIQARYVLVMLDERCSTREDHLPQVDATIASS